MNEDHQKVPRFLQTPRGFVPEGSGLRIGSELERKVRSVGGWDSEINLKKIYIYNRRIS